MFFFYAFRFPFSTVYVSSFTEGRKLTFKKNQRLDMIGGLGTSLNPKFKRRSFHVPNLISI